MSFDPDKYLAEKSSFDPDQYLAEKHSPVVQEEGLSSGDFTAHNPLMALFGMLGGSREAFGHKAVDAATMGYAPQVAGAIEKAKGGDYLKGRDAEIANLERLKQSNPISSNIGTGMGMAASIPAMEAVGGAVLPARAAQVINASRIGKAAVTGGGMGALMNPGDEVGVIDPVQLKGRALNAAVGAVAGPVLEKGIGAVGAIPQKLIGAGKSLTDLAEKTALRSAGAQKPQIKALNNAGRTSDVGRFIIDENLAPAGASGAEILENAQSVRKQAGQEIGAVFDQIEKSGKAGTFSRKDVAQAMRDSLHMDDAVGGSLDAEKVLGQLEQYVTNFEKKEGPATARELLELKGKFDGRINYSKKAMELPELQQGYRNLRTTVNEAINNRAEALSNEVKGPLAQKLKAANTKYGLASHVTDLAENKANMEGNNFFSLRDSMAAGAGLSGMIAHGAGGPKAIAAAAAAALASKAARKYGPSATIAAADTVAPMLTRAGRALSGRGMPQVPNAIRLAALEEGLQSEAVRPSPKLNADMKRARLKAMGE